MITSDVYRDSPEKITNDLIVTKLAATDTSRNTTITALCHLAKNEKSRNRVREEIKICIKKYGLNNANDFLREHLSPANFQFLNQVIDECLRFNPPAPSSDDYIITKDCKLGNFNFKAGTVIMMNIWWVHMNPNEWQKPEEFHPDRFDPNHPLFLAPSGKPRNEMSFIPFNFGERKCLGYMFAKAVIPSLTTKIIHNFDLSLQDPKL